MYGLAVGTSLSVVNKREFRRFLYISLKALTGHTTVASSLGWAPGGSALSLYGSVGSLPVAVLGITTNQKRPVLR